MHCAGSNWWTIFIYISLVECYSMSIATFSYYWMPMLNFGRVNWLRIMMKFVGIWFRFGDLLFAKGKRFIEFFGRDIEFDSLIKRLNYWISQSSFINLFLISWNLSLNPTRHLAISSSFFRFNCNAIASNTNTTHCVASILKRDRDFKSLNAVIRSTRQVRKRTVFVSLIFLHYGKLN